jgi:hypothetical protein
VDVDEAHRQRLEADLRVARAGRAAAIKRAVAAENLRSAVFGLTENGPGEPPPWSLELSVAKDAPHVPVLVTSDLHFGETIAPGAMGGLNEFNLEIAARRYRRLIEKTCDIAVNHLPRNTYQGIVLLRLGDTVSGDIHDELSKTNDLPTLPVCRWAQNLERWGINALADVFGQVYVVSVPGNHGRLTRKPESKGTVTQSYDSLISWWLESLFEGDDRVTFFTPESGDAVFDIHSRRYLATHGDRIGSRGGQGYIGAAATILRGMRKIVDTQAQIKQPVDRIFLGHFHVAMDLELGWANGSLPGYSEFGRDNRMSPQDPIQWLIFMHPRYGATSQWRILVDKHITDRPVPAPFSS